MVTMQDDGSKKKRGPNANFTDDFKENAVKLVLDEGMGVEAVWKDLGIPRSTFMRWLKQARIDRGEAAAARSSPLSTDERKRLMELEKENRELRLERELLKKWAAFFAKETSK